MTYPITRTSWLEIMFRHGNNKLMAFGTACVRTALWPHPLCASFNTAPINPHFRNWSFLPSWKPRSQLKIFSAVGCICIDCKQRSPLTWTGCTESQLGGYYGNKRDTATQGCSTIPFTDVMLSLCLCVTLLPLPKPKELTQVWCHKNVVDWSHFAYIIDHLKIK